MKSLKAIKLLEMEAKRKIEQAYNFGFKEYTYDESLRKAKLIKLANGKVVDAEELKRNISDILDAIVNGDVEEARFHIRLDGNLDFAMRIKGETKVADLRLGVDEHIKP